MKRIIITCISLGIFYHLHAQTPIEEVSQKIAQKMKDTLSLSELQKQSIYQVNLSLAQQKQQVRQQHTQIDSVTRYVQQIEIKRDTLYHPYLTQEQYQLYKQKKRYLVSNN